MSFPSIYEQVFESLEIQLSKNIYKPVLLRRTPDNLAALTLPLVILTEVNNAFNSETLCHTDQTYTAQFEIEIYSQDVRFGVDFFDRKDIAESIRDDVDLILNEGHQEPFAIRLKRTLSYPIPNVDANLYRLLMRYRGTLRVDTNTIYRF